MSSAQPTRNHEEQARLGAEMFDRHVRPRLLAEDDGKFVAIENDKAILKDIGRAKPDDAESFQWVNLMRGDTMLMSLTNHQYLATKPNTPGPVTATALGASPARKSGAEFKWKTIN